MAQIVPETRETLESAGWQFTDKESIYAGCAAISKDEAGNYVWDLTYAGHKFDVEDPSGQFSVSREDAIASWGVSAEFLDNFNDVAMGLVIKAELADSTRFQATLNLSQVEHSAGTAFSVFSHRSVSVERIFYALRFDIYVFPLSGNLRFQRVPSDKTKADEVSYMRYMCRAIQNDTLNWGMVVGGSGLTEVGEPQRLDVAGLIARGMLTQEFFDNFAKVAQDLSILLHLDGDLDNPFITTRLVSRLNRTDAGAERNVFISPTFPLGIIEGVSRGYVKLEYWPNVPYLTLTVVEV
jgi:hypothetical protein